MTPQPTPRYVREEIAPAAGRLAAGSRPGARALRGAAAPGRVRRGDRLRDVLVHGRGVRRAARGRGPRARPTAFAASELPAGRSYDRVVAISRSGTTTEVLRALASVTRARRGDHRRRRHPGGRRRRRTRVVLDFADERSVVQTVFATTTLMLLRASLGESVEPVVAQAEQVLAGGIRPTRHGRPSTRYTFLGQGWAYGIAQEAALKCREACRLWTESYPQMEYRHGPIAIAQPGRAVWVFGRPVAGLLDDVRRTGALVVDDDLDPVVDLVRAQLLAVERAEAAGLDPDRPRSLTRSVVLAESRDPLRVPNPAVDVTYHVDRLHPSGTTRVRTMRSGRVARPSTWPGCSTGSVSRSGWWRRQAARPETSCAGAWTRPAWSRSWSPVARPPVVPSRWSRATLRGS